MISCLLEDKSRVLPRLRKREVASAKKKGVLPRLIYIYFGSVGQAA